jgi:hypothetical protein
MASALGGLVANAAASNAIRAMTLTVIGIISYEIGWTHLVSSSIRWTYSKYRHLTTVELMVEPIDPAYEWVLHWIQSQAKNVRSRRIFPNLNDTKRMCDFIPNQAFTTSYQYTGRKIWVEVTPVTSLSPTDDSIQVPFHLTFGTSDPQAPITFMKTCNDQYYQQVGVNLYTWAKERGWMKLSKKKPRSLDTVYLKLKLKADILKDLHQFLISREDYETSGTPYRRSYLFHGPGGTGKSSTIFALAGMMGYDIYIFNLSDPDLTDNEVIRAVQEIYSNSIIVFEDLDFIIDQMKRSDSTMSLTLSGIYNILDGHSTPSDVLMFITTNNLDKLPRNLTRPGRVDQIYNFDYLDVDQFREIIAIKYPTLDVDDLISKLDVDFDELQLTPAEVIKWLLNLTSASQVLTDFSTFLDARSHLSESRDDLVPIDQVNEVNEVEEVEEVDEVNEVEEVN